ncbi:NAD-dependent epimerase/dehydratase family protein [Rhodohalobacter sp. SW132]|uniref:NAD-dependent epimerase/dehydratase family protein n=1 Tax=Rhodohalobacter sp. SW132 TaxID=2293433 RepID=UPI000E286461|nr:NAD-dependent epimerase/dehydratase family protein [Rhodohalobacter sp. SW132]REL33187.1 NAD-dependent epimerase/dehydratase family protein [Rhodohalobacter sp. SW132]
MKAFVTGGTGFIGSHLADHLIASDEYSEVKCLVRSSDKWLEGKSFTKVKGDLHSIPAISNALSDVDVIFHLAGVVSAPTKKDFFHANVDATENLIRLAAREGVHNIVILSSLAAVGPSNGTPRTESDPMLPVSMYGKSKKEMEGLIKECITPDMSVKVLRPPAVYGPREDQIYTLFKIMKYGVAPIVGDGTSPELSMVYVSDIVQGIEKAAARDEKGISTYFISGQITCWNEIKEICDTVMGKKSMSLKLNPGIVKKVAGFIETTASLFGSYPVVNREKAREMILEWTCSYEKAERELGYTPNVSLAEGISRTLHWYKKNNWL